LDIVNRLPQQQQKLLPESSRWASTTKATSTTDFEQQSVLEPSSKNETPIIPNIRQQQVNTRQQQQCKFFVNGNCRRGADCNFLHQDMTSLKSKEKPKQQEKVREKTCKKEQPSELKRQEDQIEANSNYNEIETSYTEEGNNEIETSYTEEDVYNYARDGDIDELRNALKQEEIYQWYTDSAGFNALHLAVRNGHSACVAALLDKVDIRLVDKRAKSNGYSPLHYAARLGFEKIVILLCDKGASLNLKNDQGYCALHIAAKFDHANIVSMLIERGADVASKTIDGRTVVNVATFGVIEKCANLSTRVYTPKDVYSYAFAGDIKSLLLALNYGDNCSSWYIDSNGCSAVHCGFLDVMGILLDRGFDVNFRNKGGGTALHAAAYFDQIEVVKFLLDRGADIESKCKKGITPLIVAAQKGRERCIRLLCSRSASRISKALSVATKYGHIESVRALCELGGDVNYKGKSGLPLLVRATFRHQEEIKKILLEYGAEITPNFHYTEISLRPFSVHHIRSKV